MKKLVISTIAIVLLAGCGKKEGPAGAQGPKGDPGTNGSSTTGTMIIKVNQFDQYGTQLSSNLNMATVTIDGTNIVGVTNANGNVTLSQIPAGSYNLTVQRNGFGLMKQYEVIHPGNGNIVYTVGISEIPTFSITTAYAKDTLIAGLAYLKLGFSLPSLAKIRNVLFVMGTNATTLDPTDPSSYKFAYYFNQSSNQTSASAQLFYANQGSKLAVLPAGTTIYCKVYPIPTFNSYSFTYINPLDDNLTYTSLGTMYPTVLSFIKQ